MPKLEVLVGMIGSGKSTYARSRAAEGALVVNHDDLTEMLHGCYRYEPGLKPLYLSMMKDVAFLAMAAGKDVLIDRTHLTREARKVWVDYAANMRLSGLAVQILAVEFKAEDPAVHARRRFDADDRGRDYLTWLAVAQHHYRQWAAEPLNWPAEGFDGVVAPVLEWTGPKVPAGSVREAPRDSCVCGFPDAPGTVHRADGPCYRKAADPRPRPHCGATREGHAPKCPVVKEVAGDN